MTGRTPVARRARQAVARVPMDFDAGEHLHLVGENLARLKVSVAVLVLEDDDPIAEV